MPHLRSIVFTSVLVGLIVGIAVSIAQFVATSPLIRAGEVYEEADHVATHDLATHASSDLAATPHHDHENGSWQPADGFERNAFTLVANVLTAIGYALVLTGLIALRGKPVTWRVGLLWGLAGFACVMLAPMAGLPPQLPGTPAAPLGARQIWWIATALATAAGLCLIAFRRTRWGIFAACVLLALPHLIGAPPAPEGTHASAPEALQHQFLVAAVLTSLLFWTLLGSLSGGFLRKFARWA